MTLNNPYVGEDSNGDERTFDKFTVQFSTAPRLKAGELKTILNMKFFGTVDVDGSVVLSKTPFKRIVLSDVAGQGDVDELTAFDTIQVAIQNYVNAKNI